MRRTAGIPKALSAACALALAFSATAQAAGPATVTVRVEGQERTLLPASTVTTNTTPVDKDGNAEDTCTGTSAAGALELATSGNWGGTFFGPGLGYSVETILGESHAFEEGAAANTFWAFWLNNAPSPVGVCEVELNPGDSILFFTECFSKVGACPAPPNPLGVSAPATAEAGSPVSVSVTSYANATGAASPAAGATVSAAGTSATTDASGHATLTLAQTGEVTLNVSAPGSVRTEATVCVHKGNDGTCGTTAPAAGTSPSAVQGVAGLKSAYTGAYAVVARATGILDGHVYPAARAPRVLSGTVLAHTSVRSVSVRLRRSYKGRCFAYDGAREAFARVRCGRGSFFAVSRTATFSYLLPAALARGRYVLDIEATDAAGNRTSLARGSSRIVFYVR
jgi:hypothetical protein